MSPTTIQEALRATNQIFEEEVVRQRNFQALERVYTEDARILPPGAPMVSGREAIIGFWKSAIEGLGVETGRLESVELIVSDYITEIGRASLNLVDGSSVDAKYVVTWKREVGSWKWHVDIWNING
jgi:ketosteroid isomerase-like protein